MFTLHNLSLLIRDVNVSRIIRQNRKNTLDRYQNAPTLYQACSLLKTGGGGGVVVKKMNLKIQSIKINTYNCVISVYVNVTHLFVCSHVGVPQRFCFFG